jgi:Domain of Unknown Function (DUF928)
MKSWLPTLATTAALMAAAVWTARADDNGPTTRPVHRIVYQPPPHSTSGMRINGTSRGAADNLPMLYFLSPDHVGLTTQDKPSVFWFLSKDTSLPCVLTLTEDNQADPCIEIHLNGSKAGVHRTDFESQNFTLKDNVQYQLSLALIPDSTHRSNDRFCSAYIKKVDPSAALVAKLGLRARPEDRAVVYAQQGIWYDALMVLSDQIESQPGNASLREERADLLEQVNLPEAATFDRDTDAPR